MWIGDGPRGVRGAAGGLGTAATCAGNRSAVEAQTLRAAAADGPSEVPMWLPLAEMRYGALASGAPFTVDIVVIHPVAGFPVILPVTTTTAAPMGATTEAEAATCGTACVVWVAVCAAGAAAAVCLVPLICAWMRPPQKRPLLPVLPFTDELAMTAFERSAAEDEAAALGACGHYSPVVLSDH